MEVERAINQFIGKTIISLVERYGFEWCHENQLKKILISLYGQQPEIEAILLVKKEIIDDLYISGLSDSDLALRLDNLLRDKKELTEEIKWATTVWMSALNENTPFSLHLIDENNGVQDLIAPITNEIILEIEEDKTSVQKCVEANFLENKPKKIRRIKGSTFVLVLAIIFFSVLMVNNSSVHQKDANESVSSDVITIQPTTSSQNDIKKNNKKVNTAIENYKADIEKGKIKSCEYKLNEDLTQTLAKGNYQRNEQTYIYDHSYDGCTYHLIEEDNRKKVTKVTKTKFRDKIDYLHVREIFGEPKTNFLDIYSIKLHYYSNDNFEVEMIFDKLDDRLVELSIKTEKGT